MANDKAARPNLAQFIERDTIDHEVKRFGEPTGWIWKLAAFSHPDAVAQRKARLERQKRRQQILDAKVMNAKKIKPEDFEVDTEREDMEMFSSRVLGFNEVDLGVEGLADPVQFSTEKVLDIFLHPKTRWVFNEIAGVLNNDRDFTPASEKD